MESKISKYVGLTLVILGIIGTGGIIEGLTDIPNIVTRDVFAVGVGLILWRLSKEKEKE